MDDIKNQTILISSVTHSEAAILTDEKISHYGMPDFLDYTLPRVGQVDSAYRFRGVTAS